MALHITQVLVRPLITEKNNVARETRNEVVFEIHPDANKAQVRHAVKQLFGVDVAEVRTISKSGKLRRVGTRAGYRADTKKAIVRVADGQNIDFFQGV